jgi:hypothetical protein
MGITLLETIKPIKRERKTASKIVFLCHKIVGTFKIIILLGLLLAALENRVRNLKMTERTTFLFYTLA